MFLGDSCLIEDDDELVLGTVPLDFPDELRDGAADALGEKYVPDRRVRREHGERLGRHRTRRSLKDGLRGKKGRSILEFENGVAKVTLRPIP